MSNRKKPEPPKGPPPFKPTMTVVPSIFVNQFEFNIEGGFIGFRFGRQGQTHADVTMPVNLAIDMSNLIQEKIVAVIRHQHAPQAPPAEAPAEPVKPEEPKP